MRPLVQGYTRHNMNDHSLSTCLVPDTARNFTNMFSAKPPATVWGRCPWQSCNKCLQGAWHMPGTVLGVGKVVANKTANAETGNKPIRRPNVKSGVKSYWEKWTRKGRKRMLGWVGGSLGIIVLTLWSGKASLRRGEDRVLRERTVLGKGIRFWGRASDLPKTTQNDTITGQLCGRCFKVIIHNHYSNPA